MFAFTVSPEETSDKTVHLHFSMVKVRAAVSCLCSSKMHCEPVAVSCLCSMSCCVIRSLLRSV